MITQFESLIKFPKKLTSQNNNRKIEGIQLKIPVEESYHESVMLSDRNSSMRNVANTTYFNSESSFSRNSSLHSLASSKVLPNILPTSQKKPITKMLPNNQISHFHSKL